LRLWITRAQPGADETAQRLRALGRQPLTAPVLEVRRRDGPIDLAGVGALAFTSANGVRAFAGLSAARAFPVFAVGAATAGAARAAGFAQVESACGDVSALARRILAHRDGICGAVLHPTTTRPAGDLVGELARAGLIARAVRVYETVEIAALPLIVASALEDATLDGLVLHSPRAGRVAARLLSAPAVQGAALKLTAFALSPACLAPLEGLALGRRISAARPMEDDLLSQIARS
jgi:uroporphyrinogen-III synthase